MNTLFRIYSVYLVIALLNANAAIAERHIVTQGIGEASGDADQSKINLVIRSIKPSAKQAQADVAEEYQRLKSSFQKFGLKPADYPTTHYSIQEQKEYQSNKTRSIGFQVRHDVLITLKGSEKVGGFVDSLASDKKDANATKVEIENITWTDSKSAERETQALEAAVDDCKNKAQAIAKASKSSLGVLQRVTYGADNVEPGPRRNFGKMAAMAEMASTEMSVGPIKHTAAIVCEYEVK